MVRRSPRHVLHFPKIGPHLTTFNSFIIPHSIASTDVDIEIQPQKEEDPQGTEEICCSHRLDPVLWLDNYT